MNGIINVNKPAGMSSNRCMQIVKRRLGLGKVGFLGTLDPAASGVLVLLCGTATRLADFLHGRAPHPDGKLINKEAGNRKTYRAGFTWGLETTTLDSVGEVVATSDVIPTRAQVRAVLPSLVGDTEIEVPKFSAVHIGGRRAYDLARAGTDFTAPRRVVNITRFELIECEGRDAPQKEFFFEIECQTGTYIRSLAKLLAQKLGTLAIASTIIRTRVGQFDIKDAKTPDEVTPDDIMPPV